MKTIFLSVSLVLALTLSAQEQNALPSRTLLKFSPQHFFVNTLMVGTEHFNSTLSGSWNFSVGVRNQGNNNSFGPNILGADVNVQYRRYVRPMQATVSRKNRSFTQGVYVGPFIQGGFHTVENTFGVMLITDPFGNPVQHRRGWMYETWNVAGGFTLGVQRTLWQVLVLDVFAGGGLRHANTNVISNEFGNVFFNDVFDPGYTGIFPRIGFKIGITL